MAYLGRKGASAALTSADIPNNSITADKIVDGAVGVADIGASAVGTSEMAASVIGVKPHIIPDVLHPAYEADATGAGKLLDGTTEHGTGTYGGASVSTSYGTVQTDGRKYYFTNIAGSKPIKDPRIGSHFGSQRHMFKSAQLLEQETATHGSNVYSIDGREWIRGVFSAFALNNNTASFHIELTTGKTDNTSFIEITGYFNLANFLIYSYANGDEFNLTLNGAANSSVTDLNITTATPLTGRYVPAASVVNLTFDSTPTLGINTIKIGNDSAKYLLFYGIELIAQDTSNVNNIQIPSQNVVSYGKKFTVSGTPHYNPFAFAGDGTTAVAIGDTTSHGKVATGWTGSTSAYFDSTLDTATSLGLSAWETGGDFYRPINGGRVVRWVDSSGSIKTSVNMMPPCATALVAGSDASLPTSHAWTSVYQPKIKSGSIDHSLAEVAKTFNWREFGNGSANGNATYADASTLNSSAVIAYVMDDGLTSFSGAYLTIDASGHAHPNGNGNYWYYTFIGTGISIKSSASQPNYGWYNIAQNLPYGTHVLKGLRDSATAGDYTIDGVAINDVGGYYASLSEVTIHQPKMPPIPEDAVVIADYMLMADFVVQTAGTVGHLSKGVRMVSTSRDHFYDAIDGADFTDIAIDINTVMGVYANQSAALLANDTATIKLPYFGTDFLVHHYANRVGTITENLNSDAGTSAAISTSAYEGITKHTGNALGLNEMKNHITDGQNDDRLWTAHSQVATPIHTSSHYQTFETPFLHELVGGDRNMEQTNLVVTPDGKTWDEVTRDVGYIGASTYLNIQWDDSGTSSGVIIWSEHRGGATSNHNQNKANKGFAYSYDRIIILEDGLYNILCQTYSNALNVDFSLKLNNSAASGTGAISALRIDPADETAYAINTLPLKRGDYLVAYTNYNLLKANTILRITKIES